ncbi:MAG: CCDC90 family protein [Zoogloeaceae bacterium]|jgi:hypothetical protein|nr:CCDC90 family protein [Zoogloeaceae bacterium]
MSYSIAFDTLEFAKTLEEKGFQPQQAEGMSAALKQVFQDRETRTQEEIRGATTELATRADLKAEVNRLESKIDAVKFDMLKWYVSGLLAQTIAIGYLIIRLVG